MEAVTGTVSAPEGRKNVAHGASRGAEKVYADKPRQGRQNPGGFDQKHVPRCYRPVVLKNPPWIASCQSNAPAGATPIGRPGSAAL